MRRAGDKFVRAISVSLAEFPSVCVMEEMYNWSLGDFGKMVVDLE